MYLNIGFKWFKFDRILEIIFTSSFIFGFHSYNYIHTNILNNFIFLYSDEDKTAYQMDATDPLLFASPTSFKHRCNTLPAKDLARMSQIFTAESDYVPMSPGRLADKPRKPSITESLYMPMSPVINLKNRIVESYYMSMTGSKKN